MDQYITWLHLSDLHLCSAKDGWDSVPVLDRLLNDLTCLQRTYSLHPDLIFFTGDAAFGQIGPGGLSLDEQFKQADKFFQTVRFSFEPKVAKENLFIIPGNHDVNRAHIPASVAAWLGTMNAASINKMLNMPDVNWEICIKRLDNFRNFLKAYDYAHLLDDPTRLIFSACREVAGYKVGIAGLNTAWSCSEEKEKGKLWMGAEWQIQNAKAKFRSENPDITIALMHHPINWLVSAEDPLAGRLLEQNFTFSLHGHEHLDWVQYRDQHVSISGAAGYDRSDADNGYNMVRIDTVTGEGEIYLRRYDRQGGGWVQRIIFNKTDNDGRWKLINIKPFVQTTDVAITAKRIIPIKAIKAEHHLVAASFKGPLIKGNVLGDLNAEHDVDMLERAFYKSPDYMTLTEMTDKNLIVGRRGTGKTALVQELAKYWGAVERTTVISVFPQEDQIIATGPILKKFGDRFGLIRAGSRIAWRYALMMEMLDRIEYYKRLRSDDGDLLTRHLRLWRMRPPDISARLRETLSDLIPENTKPEIAIGELATKLELTQIQKELETSINKSKRRFVLLIDKLDEGYEPTEPGIAFISGLVYGALDLRKSLNVQVNIFIRDNIFRGLVKLDPDYSPNVESSVLRLHWTEEYLFTLVCKRLRVAFGLEIEQDVKVWDRCTERDLKGRNGFRLCLRSTLYRPRDLLALLNSAFSVARESKRTQIVPDDFETAKTITSENRLSDLKKEYSDFCPGLSVLVSAFVRCKPKLTYDEAMNILTPVFQNDNLAAAEIQDLISIGSPEIALKLLFGIGFIGLQEQEEGTIVFCHDGQNPLHNLRQAAQLIVHPCYWPALNVLESEIDAAQAQEIFDEYEILVTSENREIRHRNLDRIVSELTSVPVDSKKEGEFIKWCRKAIGIVFADGLRVVEIKGRELVANNVGKEGVWKDLFDMGIEKFRATVFNVDKCTPEHLSAAAKSVGAEKIAFLITREETKQLTRGHSLDDLRAVYIKTGVLVIKVCTDRITALIEKIRDPQKHDTGASALRSLIKDFQIIVPVTPKKQ
jgi:hypothetical protein